MDDVRVVATHPHAAAQRLADSRERLRLYMLGGENREEARRHFLVDGDDGRRLRIVAPGEITARDERNAHRGKIARTDYVKCDARVPFRAGNEPFGEAFDYIVKTEAEKAEMEVAITAGAQDMMKYEADCDAEGYTGTFKSVEAVDELTVKFTLCAPDPAFPAKVAFSAFGIHSSEYLESTGGGGDLVVAGGSGTGSEGLDASAHAAEHTPIRPRAAPPASRRRGRRRRHRSRRTAERR